MPRTPPTIVAPLPSDPRIFALAKASGLTTREAFAAAAECWAWVADYSVDDIVVNAAPDSLDAVVDVDGFGQAMLQAGLVGTVDGGLVVPAELRRRQREKRGGRAAAGDEDAVDRIKAGAAKRQRDKYWRDKRNPPAVKPNLPPPAEPAGQKRTRRLGEIEGFPVMLLWSRQGNPFYKLAGAMPDEVTGTVTDPENPSFADALVSLYTAMKRKVGKGLGDPATMRPTPEAVLLAADRYRAQLDATAAETAQRDRANLALDEASVGDQDDAFDEPAERETSRQPHALLREGVRPHANLTPTCGDTVAASPCHEGELGGDTTCEKPHANLTLPAPSSSNSFLLSGSQEEICKEKPTTTSSVTDAKRHHEVSILDRIAPTADPQHRQAVERIAKALNRTTDAVEWQQRNKREFLYTELKLAGLDPQTGLPVNAEAPHEPAGATTGIQGTTEPTARHEPAGANVCGPGAREFDCDQDDLRQALRRLGISPPAVQALPDDCRELRETCHNL